MDSSRLEYLQSLTRHVTGYTLLQTSRFEDRATPIRCLPRSNSAKNGRTGHFLEPLIGEGYVEIVEPVASPPFDFVGTEAKPLLFWWPHPFTPTKPPDVDEKLLRKLSTHLRNRELPEPRRLLVVVATEKGAEATGGVCHHISNGCQLGHDLSVSDLAVLERRTAQISHRFICELVNDSPPQRNCFHNLLDDWRGEAWLKANKISVDGYYPDLACVWGSRISYAIEFGGRYDVARLKDIHDKCSAHEVAYGVF
jgi:hypothetical protein